MENLIMCAIGIIIAITGIVNTILITRFNPNSKKNLEKRKELVELERRISEIESGKAVLVEHDLIDD